MQSSNIKRNTAIFLIAVVLCSIIAGCTQENPQPEDTIFLLQDAINTFDVDTLLQCIDSEWAIRIEALLTLTVGKDSVSFDSFITLLKTIMPILPFISDGTISPDDMPEVEFTVLKTNIIDETASVAVSGILTWGEYTKPFAATVVMKLENDVWVICGVR